MKRVYTPIRLERVQQQHSVVLYMNGRKIAECVNDDEPLVLKVRPHREIKEQPVPVKCMWHNIIYANPRELAV